MASKLIVVAGDKDLEKPPRAVQERTRKRRRVLTEVVMQLIKERGFSAVSVNEVAERASLSIGGLYRHIDTKSDLLEMVCDEINLDLLEEMKVAAAGARGASAKLAAVIRVYWLRHWDSSSAILVTYREYPSFSAEAKKRYREEERRLAEFFADLIRAGMVSDEFREVDDRLLAYEIILLSHMRALKGYTFEGRDRDDVLTEVLELVFSRLRKGEDN
jgi:AcrR family transcriptional regulator